MKTLHSVHPNAYQRMNTDELRENFMLQNLFQPDKLDLVYWENERTVVGSAVPTRSPLTLKAGDELAADYFFQRREAGVLNVGATGQVTVDGTDYDLNNGDCLYIGRGCKNVSFSSHDPETPARFYILSYPAHTDYPTTAATREDVTPVRMGSSLEGNQRTIHKYIHPEGIQSCQLVMGFTELEKGSVWNTMPCHTHARRSEVYLYFKIEKDAAVFHLMGPPDETRHLVVRNEQVALSPIWSIHSGCGTGSYSFIWGMGGENQAFTDMDAVAMDDLR